MSKSRSLRLQKKINRRNWSSIRKTRSKNLIVIYFQFPRTEWVENGEKKLLHTVETSEIINRLRYNENHYKAFMRCLSQGYRLYGEQYDCVRTDYEGKVSARITYIIVYKQKAPTVFTKKKYYHERRNNPCLK